jgi:hypothetical protein
MARRSTYTKGPTQALTIAELRAMYAPQFVLSIEEYWAVSTYVRQSLRTLAKHDVAHIRTILTDAFMEVCSVYSNLHWAINTKEQRHYRSMISPLRNDYNAVLEWLNAYAQM